MSLPRAFCLPRDSQGLKLKLFLFVIPLIRSSRDTSRSPRDRRSQKWNCRSPSTAWRYSIPRRKWAQKILDFLYRSAGAATPTPVTWSSADNKHRVEKRSDLVSTFIKWVNNECLVFVCVFFFVFFPRMCSTTVSCTGYPSVQMTRRIKGYSLLSAKTPNPTNTSATCLTVKSV